jgi:hypothetical protein
MKPSESKFVQKLMEDGKPFILATYASSKLVLGERVSTETGKKEPYGSIIHGLILNDEVKSVQERLEEERLKAALLVPRDAEGKPDRKAAKAFISINPGEMVVLLLKTFVWDESMTGGKRKMQLRIGGNVVPLT